LGTGFEALYASRAGSGKRVKTTFDLYVAGAHVDANHPMGPTASTACNVTLLSYGGSMDIGINSDTAAVDAPEALRDCVADGLAEMIVAGS
jgi:uncharacterized protein DUF1298